MRQMLPLRSRSKETPQRGGACCSRQVTAGRLCAALPQERDHQNNTDDQKDQIKKHAGQHAGLGLVPSEPGPLSALGGPLSKKRRIASSPFGLEADTTPLRVGRTRRVHTAHKNATPPRYHEASGNAMSNHPPHPNNDVEHWLQSVTCGGCQAARLLHWEREPDELRLGGNNDKPQHAVALGNHYAVVHCDYFRRRVEQPDKLSFCGAKRSG